MEQHLAENPESHEGAEGRILRDLENLVLRVENAKLAGGFKEGQPSESLLVSLIKKFQEVVEREKGKRVTGYDHKEGKYI